MNENSSIKKCRSLKVVVTCEGGRPKTKCGEVVRTDLRTLGLMEKMTMDQDILQYEVLEQKLSTRNVMFHPHITKFSHLTPTNQTTSPFPKYISSLSHISSSYTIIIVPSSIPSSLSCSVYPYSSHPLYTSKFSLVTASLHFLYMSS